MMDFYWFVCGGRVCSAFFFNCGVVVLRCDGKMRTSSPETGVAICQLVGGPAVSLLDYRSQEPQTNKSLCGLKKTPEILVHF